MLLTERVHTAMQIPQRNQGNSFLHIPNLGAIVCDDAHQAHGSRPHHLTDQSTSTVTILYDLYDVTTSSPLRGFYFWHFKCWICCLVFKNPNQNVRTCGQSRTQPKAYSKAARYTLEAWELSASQNHQDDLAPSLHLTKRKDVKNKAHKPLLTVFM